MARVMIVDDQALIRTGFSMILNGEDDPLLLQTLAEDDSRSHEEALLKIYTRLRPGNPPQIEKARDRPWERSQYLKQVVELGGKLTSNFRLPVTVTISSGAPISSNRFASVALCAAMRDTWPSAVDVSLRKRR